MGLGVGQQVLGDGVEQPRLPVDPLEQTGALGVGGVAPASSSASTRPITTVIGPLSSWAVAATWRRSASSAATR